VLCAIKFNPPTVLITTTVVVIARPMPVLDVPSGFLSPSGKNKERFHELRTKLGDFSFSRKENQRRNRTIFLDLLINQDSDCSAMEEPFAKCVPPTKENTKTTHEVEVMFNSHNWKLLKAESQYGNKGVLIRMVCQDCGADKIAILAEDPET
jgi:hypothetical protein